MPKFGKYRIKNQLSCLIFENPALIPIQMQRGQCGHLGCDFPPVEYQNYLCGG